MTTPHQIFPAGIEQLLSEHGGPLTVAGQLSDYVIMRPDVYAAMLGLMDDGAAETLAAVRRGLADFEAGRTQDLDEAFNELDRHEPQCSPDSRGEG